MRGTHSARSEKRTLLNSLFVSGPSLKALSFTMPLAFCTSSSATGQRRPTTLSKLLLHLWIVKARSSVQITPKSPKCFSITLLSESSVFSVGASGSLNMAFLCTMLKTFLKEGRPQKMNGLHFQSSFCMSSLQARKTPVCRCCRPNALMACFASLEPPRRPVLIAMTIGGGLWILWTFLRPFRCSLSRRRRSAFRAKQFLTSVSARTMLRSPFL
mmetsp:Transcript_143287/g.399449  ORF Transcript_143287/g.399449 Transcript_143287/m.399449 type:complete len:214 (-) Transcript_143287:239-880(-)